ncbi:hypothetical protein KRR40_14895 [Niabella defluvii]|nr:hypothetical protein KRR40_14895 [Niabella sp. I65]
MHEMLKAAGSTQAHEDLIRVVLLRFLMLADEASGKKQPTRFPIKRY